MWLIPSEISLNQERRVLPALSFLSDVFGVQRTISVECPTQGLGIRTSVFLNSTRSLGGVSSYIVLWGDPLEKGMATHSSILAWRIPWTD